MVWYFEEDDVVLKIQIENDSKSNLIIHENSFFSIRLFIFIYHVIFSIEPTCADDEILKVVVLIMQGVTAIASNLQDLIKPWEAQYVITLFKVPYYPLQSTSQPSSK